MFSKVLSDGVNFARLDTGKPTNTTLSPSSPWARRVALNWLTYRKHSHALHSYAR